MGTALGRSRQGFSRSLWERGWLAGPPRRRAGPQSRYSARVEAQALVETGTRGCVTGPSSADTASPRPAPLSSLNYPFSTASPRLHFLSQRKSLSGLLALTLTQTLLSDPPAWSQGPRSEPRRARWAGTSGTQSARGVDGPARLRPRPPSHLRPQPRLRARDAAPHSSAGPWARRRGRSRASVRRATLELAPGQLGRRSAPRGPHAHPSPRARRSGTRGCAPSSLSARQLHRGRRGPLAGERLAEPSLAQTEPA